MPGRRQLAPVALEVAQFTYIQVSYDVCMHEPGARASSADTKSGGVQLRTPRASGSRKSAWRIPGPRLGGDS